MKSVSTATFPIQRLNYVAFAGITMELLSLVLQFLYRQMATSILCYGLNGYKSLEDHHGRPRIVFRSIANKRSPDRGRLPKDSRPQVVSF